MGRMRITSKIEDDMEMMVVDENVWKMMNMKQCSKRAPQKRGNPGIRGFLSKGRANATDFDKNHKKL